jgi:hypothetical protein
MKISSTVCSYHKSLSGGTNDLIKKFTNSNLDNFHILFDNQTGLEKSYIVDRYQWDNICLYNDNTFEQYIFNKFIDTRHRWGSHQNPKYFYAHFRMLVFFIENPDFDYYWFFDDDVDFIGDLKTLLDNYKTETEDFLAIQCFKKEDYLEFPKISIINNRMSGSHGHWLEWCPGPGDNFQLFSKHIGSFFPIVRFSNRAMKFLLDIHNLGYYGYSEGFVPTTLASNGYGVASMMNEYNKYFVNNHHIQCILLHKGIPFTWEWL